MKTEIIRKKLEAFDFPSLETGTFFIHKDDINVPSGHVYLKLSDTVGLNLILGEKYTHPAFFSKMPIYIPVKVISMTVEV